MQGLVESPREHLTEEQVRGLLTGPDVTVSAGLELLDGSNRLVEDISDDLGEGGTISWDNRDPIHGSCRLPLQRRLAWGRDRVRPYMILSDAAISARFNLGVFVPSAPDEQRGEDPITYNVTGYDLLSLMQSGPADTYTVEPAAGDDVIVNGEFESDVSGWESNPGFGFYTPATFARSTTRANAGSASMLVTWPTGENSWVNQDVKVSGLVIGKTYRITARVWVPVGGPDDFRIDVIFYKSGPWVSPPRDQWTTVEFLWVASIETAFVGVATRDTTSGQQTWIDSVRMDPLSTTYFDALNNVVTLSGVGVPLLLDSTARDKLLPATRVWALTNPVPSWRRILTDLLAEIGYVPPWVDPNGNLRSRPARDPASRTVEWVLDVGDESSNIVSEERTYGYEVGDVANWWRFVRSNSETTPVEDDGIYTPSVNLSEGPNSVYALGREVRKFVPLEAVNHESLVLQGDKIRADDIASVRTVNVTIDPLPIMGFDDVFQLIDGESEKLVASSWDLSLDGSPGQLQLGGAPPEQLEPVEASAKGTVTSAAPLRVVVDGATQSSFVNALDGASYLPGDRVNLTLRNPAPPLIEGTETS